MSKEESDEEDYMSDAILNIGADVRPGLLPKNVAKQYKNEARIKELNEKSKTKPRKVLEQEKRDEGLGKSISSNNKGFSMLQKMGYKPGMGIGKTGEGRSEPVPINIKSGRGGLGTENELKRKKEEKERWQATMSRKRQRRNEVLSQNYRNTVMERFSEKQAESDLYKSQKVCAQLDAEQGFEEPSESFFWPPNYLPAKKKTLDFENVAYDEDLDKEEDEEEEEEDTVTFTASEKLEVLTGYLRSKYLYCVWCGTSFDDKEDMQRNCPGSTSEDHR